MIRIPSAAACLAALLAFPTSAAMSAEILIHDDKSQPESLAAAPDGTLIVAGCSETICRAEVMSHTELE